MNKRTYRSKKVNAINWEQLRGRWSGQALLFAVDVAKDVQYAELSCGGPDGAVLMHWDLLEGTAALMAELKGFGSPVAVVMVFVRRCHRVGSLRVSGTVPAG